MSVGCRRVDQQTSLIRGNSCQFQIPSPTALLATHKFLNKEEKTKAHQFNAEIGAFKKKSKKKEKREEKERKLKEKTTERTRKEMEKQAAKTSKKTENARKSEKRSHH